MQKKPPKKGKRQMLEIIREGYRLAKTPEQVAVVKYYEQEMEARLKRCNDLLDHFFAIGQETKEENETPKALVEKVNKK